MIACLLEWKEVKVAQLWPHGLYNPWNSPGQNTGVEFPHPGHLPNPGIEPNLLHCRQILYQLSHHREAFQRVHSNLILVLDTTCWCLVAKSYLTLCDSMNRSPPGSSVHGISHERMLGWVAISSSRGSSQPRDQTCISCIVRWVPYCWATGGRLLATTTHINIWFSFPFWSQEIWTPDLLCWVGPCYKSWPVSFTCNWSTKEVVHPRWHSYKRGAWISEALFVGQPFPTQASQVAQLVKNTLSNAREMGSISGSGRSPGEGQGNPLQYSFQENPMDRGDWWAIVHGIANTSWPALDIINNSVIWSYWDLRVDLLLQLTDSPSPILQRIHGSASKYLQNAMKTQPFALVWLDSRYIRGVLIAFINMINMFVLSSRLQDLKQVL